MSRVPVRNPLKPVVDYAIRQSGGRASVSGAGQGGIATHEDITTTPDADGYTVHPLILDLDALDDPHSVLI